MDVVAVPDIAPIDAEVDADPTLVSMGVATTPIGMLPRYASIGIAAPILLVACRLVQGITVGGEWGGAVLRATEHSPPDKRGFYRSLVQIGFPLGVALGTASFFALAYLGDRQFMSWGWRIPFVASAALVVIGTFIRLYSGFQACPARRQGFTILIASMTVLAVLAARETAPKVVRLQPTFT